MQTIVKNNLILDQFSIFNAYENICQFFTRKDSGTGLGVENFNLSLSSGLYHKDGLKHRQILAHSLNRPLKNLIFQKQVHDITICEYFTNTNVTCDDYVFANTDGMITREKDVFLMVMGADCVPLLFFEPEQQIIAVAHAGWRGTLNGIAYKMIQTLTSTYNCNATKILVGIGPSISAKNYEVSASIYDHFNQQFTEAHHWFILTKTSFHLDLWKANKDQLCNAGVLNKNIELSNICTFDNPKSYYSFRKDADAAGRFAGGICINS